MESANSETMTIVEGAPTPCAWCEDETGVRTEGSHGICERHSKAAIERYMLYALESAKQGNFNDL